MIDHATKTLLKGENLDSTAIKEVFDEIFSGIADEIKASAFITALKTKNLKKEDFVSGIISANDTFKTQGSFEFGSDTINSVTFEKDPKKVDIGLGADLICASAGLYVSKHSFIAPFEVDRSFSVLKHLGVKFKEAKPQKDIIEKSNLLYGYITNDDPFLKYTKNLFLQMKFDNILYFIYKMLNPNKAKNIAIGTDCKESAENLAQICLELNYQNSIVFSGSKGLPYISTEGQTFVAEAWKNKIFTYVLSPDLLEIAPAPDDELKVENDEQSARVLLSVFKNKEKNAARSAVILNAASMLYITKKASSLADGIKLAKKTVDDGKVYEKIEQLRKLYC